MLRRIKQVFCIHVWEYESDMFNQKECRKCGKIKCLQPCRLTGFSFLENKKWTTNIAKLIHIVN